MAVKTKCTVVNLPTEVQAGATLELNVENGEQLTGVEVNGSSVEYSLQNSILSFTLPQELTGSVTLKLISGEVFVTYNISVVSLGTLVYGESKVLGSSWSDYVYLESSVFTGATVGQVITVVVSNVQADAQGAFKIQVMAGQLLLRDMNIFQSQVIIAWKLLRIYLRSYNLLVW